MAADANEKQDACEEHRVAHVLVTGPPGTLVVFVLIFGVWFVVTGMVRFVAAYGEPERPAGNIAIAIHDVIAGIVILSWPGPSLAILGMALLYGGITLLTLRSVRSGSAPRAQ